MGDKCTYVHRVSVHPSIKVGGASLGRCENDTLPGMTVCWEHADREAMAYHIRYLSKRLDAMREARDAWREEAMPVREGHSHRCASMGAKTGCTCPARLDKEAGV